MSCETMTFFSQVDGVMNKLQASGYEAIAEQDMVMDLSRDSSPRSNAGSGSRYHDTNSRTPSPAVNPSPPVPNDPRDWSRNDVSRWLQWATAFYSLDTIDLSKFAMNGKGLCLMTRQGFLERAPTSGDVLFGDFQRRVVIALYQHRPAVNGTTSKSASSSPKSK